MFMSSPPVNILINNILTGLHLIKCNQLVFLVDTGLQSEVNNFAEVIPFRLMLRNRG
jgi:hypothetical protein